MIMTDELLKKAREFATLARLEGTLALLARLDAAEVVAEEYASEYATVDIVKKWRKAAGKCS